jgi:hypothetical protein
VSNKALLVGRPKGWLPIAQELKPNLFEPSAIRLVPERAPFSPGFAVKL